MEFEEICSPDIIYIFFSLTQIVIDTANGLYNTAFLKLWVAILFTTLLNYLCQKGLGIISWFIVFIPFILMTVIIAILLVVFGLDPSSGKQIFNVNGNKIKTDNYPAETVRTTGGYYDNYNDSNVNTMVNNDGSKPQDNKQQQNKSTQEQSDISSMLRDVDNRINQLK